MKIMKNGKKIIHKPSPATGACCPRWRFCRSISFEKTKAKNVSENEINRVSVISDDEMENEMRKKLSQNVNESANEATVVAVAPSAE